VNDPVILLKAAGEAALALPAESLPGVIGELERLKARAWLRIGEPRQTAQATEDDRLIGVKEAAGLLGTTPSSLYKRAAEYPFTVHQGRRLLFSLRGLREYIRLSQGT
jgi:hypothetical protein